MRVFSLGDSVLIDDYTGKAGGGAASQFARMIGANQFDQTAGDGIGLTRAYEILRQTEVIPDVMLFCGGGNDLLTYAWGNSDQSVDDALEAMTTTFDAIMERSVMYGVMVIACTYFDPTDGDAEVAAKMGFRDEARELLMRYNEHIRQYPGIGVTDAFRIFAGKGMNKPETYVALGVELNLAGATALARGMYETYKAMGGFTGRSLA